MPRRPTCRRLVCPAIPTTRVPKRRGPIMVLMSFRKIWERIRALWPMAGQSCPISAPTAMATRIQAVKERRFTP